MKKSILYLILFVFFHSVSVFADDHYRVVVTNKTVYPVSIKIVSKIEGLDYSNISTMSIDPGYSLSQTQRIASMTKESILRLDNGYESCTLDQGSFPILIPSRSISETAPVLYLDIKPVRYKKYACAVVYHS